jgi:hypothetical protein
MRLARLWIVSPARTVTTSILRGTDRGRFVWR